MNGKHEYNWQKAEKVLDMLIKMNHIDLLTPYEIEKETKIPYKAIVDAFNKNEIELYRNKKIAKLKRQKNFDFLFKLHFEDKLSLNDIYRKYGFSPLYTKRVFKDQGLSHLNFVN